MLRSFKSLDTALFIISVALFQLYGHNAISYAFFLIVIIVCGSFAEFQKTVKQNSGFFLLLLLFMIYGAICSVLIEMPTKRALMVWGQFIVLTILLAFLRKKTLLMWSIGELLEFLLILDFVTNILLFFHFQLPWAEVPKIRPGETYARLGGFYNNPLYSGTLTIFCLCFILANNKYSNANKCLIIAAVINLFLSGSYRFFAILLFLLFLKHFSQLRKGGYLSISIILFVTSVIILTIIQHSLGSNGMRLGIWFLAVKDILSNIWGQGFFSADIDSIQYYTTEGLYKAGVTESGLLLIGLCFGVIGLLMVILVYLNIFRKVNSHTPQMAVYIISYIFFSLSVTSFLENSLSIILNGLSIYIIGNYACKYKYNNSSL